MTTSVLPDEQALTVKPTAVARILSIIFAGRKGVPRYDTCRNGTWAVNMDARAEALKKAKKKIVDLQARMTKQVLAMATAVDELLQDVTPRHAQAFLRVSCGLAASDLSTYMKFSKTLKGAEDILQRGRVPFAVIKSLVSADADGRAEALTTIAGGAHLDTRDITVIRKRNRRDRMSPAQIIEKNRSAAITAALKRGAGQALSDLDKRAGRLISMVTDFVTQHKKLIYHFDQASREEPDVVKAYMTAFERIRLEGSHLLEHFQRVFGADIDAFGNPMIERAHSALKRYAEGRFAHNNGVRQAHARFSAEFHNNISALYVLTSRPHPAVPARLFAKTEAGELTAVPRRLSSLELCAGIGGMSLGLEGAGFDPEALFEFDANAAGSLRANRSDWNVVEQDIKTVDFASYRGKVTLLAGGLPCQPYSRAGNGLGKDDERDLFPTANAIVDAVRPKAFMFENVDGFNDAKHASHRAEIFARFAEAGYAVRTISLDAKDYGIAQERPRIFVIGMSAEHMARFRPPPVFPQWRVTLGDALEDLMAEGGWSGAKDWAERRRVQEIIRYGDAEIGGLASTLLGERRKVRKKEADRWGLREILAGETWDEPPSDAMAGMHGNGYVPGLTMKMKIRLMGLPEGYRLVGSKVSQSQQVGNAVVPRMAQAVGLAIYSALRGVEFEWETMLREPRLFYEASARIELSPPGLDDIDTSPEEICATA